MKEITDVKEVQAILKDGLRHFQEVCKENNLTYYLSNGTLLGAVKYRGFIPWDDDVDILMPREDYNRLMRLAEIDSENWELLSRERKYAWKVPFAKLSHKHTILKETSADFGCEMGINLDIFPLDNWVDNRILSRFQAVYCGLLRRFLSASLEKTFYTKRKGLKKWFLRLIWQVSHIFGTDFFRYHIEKEINRMKGKPSRFKGSVAWACYGRKERLPAKAFSGTKEVLFEGISLFAPCWAEYYLFSLYGNYKKEPPLEKQKTHHRFQIWKKEV